MGVLNKLKGRMSGLNALTKGPSKHHGPAHCNVDYMHTKHWDDMRKRNAPGPGKAGEVYGFSTGKERGSGVNAVGAGLAAGQAQQGPVQSSPGQDIHDGLAAIGAGLAAASDGENKRKESITKSKKEGKTGKEARQIWKKERAEAKAKKQAKREQEKKDKKAKKVEDKINKGKTEGKGIYYNPSEDTFRLDSV